MSGSSLRLSRSRKKPCFARPWGRRSQSLQKRINRAVRNAADQLAPYAGDGIPLIVVLDNHRQIGLQIGRMELIELFGRIGYGITIDTQTGHSVSQGWEQDDDCPLGSARRDYVSAILVNIPQARFDTWEAPDDFTAQRPMRVHLIHNPYAAVPLPLWVFSESNDKQIVRADRGWIEFQSPPASVTHDDISRRAYKTFERRGSAHGNDLDDWVDAERKVRQDIERGV